LVGAALNAITQVVAVSFNAITAMAQPEAVVMEAEATTGQVAADRVAITGMPRMAAADAITGTTTNSGAIKNVISE
jgi:hypothetical protein